MLLQYVYAKVEQIRGFLQQWWGGITNNPDEVMNGLRKNLIGKIRELHIITAALAQKDNYSDHK